MRRERRWRHFDALTDVYRDLFSLTQRLRRIAAATHPSGVYVLDDLVEQLAPESRSVTDALLKELWSIRDALDELRPRMGVGMPQRTRAAVLDLSAATLPVSVMLRSDEEFDLAAFATPMMYVRHAVQLVEFHARWDVGHIDEPPSWIEFNAKLRRWSVPRRARGLYVRRVYQFQPIGGLRDDD